MKIDPETGEVTDAADDIVSVYDEFSSVTARQWLFDVLRNEGCTISFTKVDGTERVMNCTLNKAEIQKHRPVEEYQGSDEKKDKVERKVNPDILRLWDRDKLDWRSIRFSSINSVTIGVGNGT
jgi:hypothetical protein